MRTNRILAPKGFFLGGTKAEIGERKKKRDLGLIYSYRPCLSWGLFTRNRVKAAPVLISRKNLQRGKVRALLVNSGCANACTGKRGLEDALKVASHLASELGIRKEEVLLASTGVIGRFLPLERIILGIKKLVKATEGSSDILSFAEAIMTTDTVPKIAGTGFLTGEGRRVTILGIAKGAGMIHPQLATLLVFVITDVNITRSLLKECLINSIEQSLHCLTIDGDTSTNDSVFILANGEAGNRKINGRTRDLLRFQERLNWVMGELARMIVRDGEGATKLVKITVKNGKNRESAKKLATRIALSPLVKTAIYGSDPNWGRVMAALGSAGVRIKPNVVDIYFGSLRVARNGQPADYSEKEAERSLRKDTVEIIVDLKQGKSEATVYTCDLTPEYIRINAHYRT